MDDLVAFLTARLDERQAAADAATPGPWSRGVDNLGDPYVEGANGHLIADLPFCHEHDDRRELDAAHIAANDPAYMLADVAAKRQIIALADSHAVLDSHGAWVTVREVLQLLALPYADHPDFQGSWRP